MKDDKKRKYQEYSKQKLRKEIKQRFTTTMIAALAAFEDNFGDYWGKNKEGDLSEDELDNLEIWNEVRTRILDKGNFERRAAEDELSRYTVEWNKYQMNFDFRRNNG